MNKLSEVIALLERTAEEKEHQSKNGSNLSSIAEDAMEGMVALELRNVIALLKQVTSL